MSYATYEFYTDTYLGTAITAEDFPRLAARAAEYIDQFTFDRAAVETNPTLVNKIRLANCAMAEEIQTVEGGESVGVASESLGNHSVTYIVGASETLTAPERYNIACRRYLGNTGLMYRGVA